MQDSLNFEVVQETNDEDNSNGEKAKTYRFK